MKLKLHIIFIALFALSFKSNAKGETNESNSSSNHLISVCGIVIDSKTGEALAGVKVKLIGIDAVVYTNFDGKFEFTKLTPGEYKLECNLVTYDLFNLNNLIIGTNDGNNSLILRLNPVSIKFRSKHKYEPITCG